MPRKKGYVRAGQMAFLALLPELRREIAVGRSMLSLHAEYRDRLGFGYVQFTRYVKDYGARRFDFGFENFSGCRPSGLPSAHAGAFKASSGEAAACR